MRLLVDVNYTQLLFPNRTTNVPFAFQIHEKNYDLFVNNLLCRYELHVLFQNANKKYPVVSAVNSAFATGVGIWFVCQDLVQVKMMFTSLCC